MSVKHEKLGQYTPGTKTKIINFYHPQEDVDVLLKLLKQATEKMFLRGDYIYTTTDGTEEDGTSILSNKGKLPELTEYLQKRDIK